MIIPPIKIQGKKTKLVQDIKNIARDLLAEHPEIDTWVEPFLGSGVVAFNCAGLPQIKTVIVNDINPYIVRFYNAVNQGLLTGNDIRREFNVHGDNLKRRGYDYYNEIKDRFNSDGSVMDFLFLTRTGFNGVMRFNSSGKWNVPFCKINDRLSEKVIEDLASSVEELAELFKSKKFVFMNESFEKVIESAPENAIFYCDPPYYGLQTQYYKGWGKEQEILLNRMLKDKVFIYSTWLDDGHGRNPMIHEYWNGYTVQGKSHKYNVAEKSQERKGVLEGLIYKNTENEYSLF